MGVSSLSIDTVDHELDATFSLGSPSEGTGSERSSPLGSPYSDRSEPQGHYRGITFEEILPAHLITNAPPPEVEQKRGHSKHSERRSTSSSTGAATEGQPSRKPRSYPPLKKNSGGKSRFRATARAVMRTFSMAKPKQDTRGRSDYEAV